MNPPSTSAEPPRQPQHSAPSKAARAASTVFAVAIAGLLAFTAIGKGFYPNLKEIRVEGTDWVLRDGVLDKGIAGFEVLVLIAALALHRRWWAWLLNAVFFAALAGFSAFKSWHGEACGCAGGLVEFPKYFMFALDVVIALASVAMAVALKGPKPVAAAVLVASGLFGWSGWVAADATTPPRRAETAQKHEGKTAVQRLFEAEPLRDIREQPAGGPAWMVCAFDPTCHICEAMKPLINFKREELAETGDPVLQIREFSIPDMEKQIGIEPFAWETPTVFIVQDGVVRKIWSGAVLEEFSAERFQEIYDTLAAGGYPESDIPAWARPAAQP
ncbi:MAG: hypothetical protein SFZ24_09735 [Planctomycetota bacterium]|nr:hypothetical protein [Planctomycetota bacterium]